MKPLNLPSYQLKCVEDNGQQKIFDPVRKKYLVLTPEEWVRQNFVQYLILEKGFPASLIEIEKGMKLNDLKKRADIVVNNSLGKAVLIVECKAATVKINQNVFDQIARYNMVFKVPYLIVTNGMDHYCCHIDHTNSSYSFLRELPDYSELNK